jgi:outer membrane receptor protein involved in Fe transport
MKMDKKEAEVRDPKKSTGKGVFAGRLRRRQGSRETIEDRREVTQMAKKILIITCVFAFCLAFVNVTVARAQSVLEGKITGTITDDKGEPLPGVAVELKGPSIMGKRAAVTSARGGYVFLNVPPGIYVLTATMPGFKTFIREDLNLGAGKVLEVNPALQTGAIEESVTVVGASPIVDVKTSTVDSRLEKELIAKLPTSRDAFYDLSLTTPGMFDHGSNAGWLPSPTAYSGASNENVFLVNGVNASNPRGASFGPLVKVNYNAVEEVRVVSLGAKAEYGSFSGAAIDVLTKSGSNKFHGNAGVYVEPVKWRRTNQPADSGTYGTDWLWVAHPDSPANALYGGPPIHDYELNATLGGPIIKDKIWFYGAFDYLNSQSKRARWDLVSHSWSRFADMKISAEPFKNNRAWVSYHHENSDYDGGSWGSQPEWDTTATYGTASKNDTVSAQWQWLPLSTTILTAKYLGFWTDDTPHVPADAPDHPCYINWWKWAQYGINGAFPYIEGWHSNRQTFQADVSHYAENFLGEHDIKFGAQFTRGRSNSLGGYFQNYVNFLYPYRWTQNVANMQSYGDTGLIFYNLRDSINPFLTVATSDSLAFFLDDQWSPTKKLTINLGLRYDRMTAKYGHGFEYEPLTKPTDIANPTVLRVRADSPNIFDFKTFSPRLGITYILTKDAKTVARASFGRYYVPITVEYLRRYGPDCPTVTRRLDYYSVPWSIADANHDGTIDTLETRAAARTIYGMDPINAGQFLTVNYPAEDRYSYKLQTDPNLKDQYSDQFTLNLEREVLKDFSVSATFIYKHAAHIFANVPINRDTGKMFEYDRIPFTDLDGKTVELYSYKWPYDYDHNGVIDNEDIRYISNHTDYEVMNMETIASTLGAKAKRDYQGYQLVFNKRYSNRWQMLGSLLFSHSTGLANRIYSQDMNFEGPMVTDNNWMSTLNYSINNMTGPLPFTPKFEFKVSGSYTIPKVELDLGLRFRMHTGRPVWELQDDIPLHTASSNPPGGIVGAGIGNIVGTTTPRYLPTQTIVDFRLEKTIRMAKYGSVQLVLDVFNLFNSNTPDSIDYQWEFGKVGGIIEPRTFRLSFLYQF